MSTHRPRIKSACPMVKAMQSAGVLWPLNTYADAEEPPPDGLRRNPDSNVISPRDRAKAYAGEIFLARP